MKNTLRNIFNLSKLFIKENNQFNLIDTQNGKINKKSAVFWIYLVLLVAIIYISSEVMEYVVKTGQPQIFLNGFLLFLQILVIIRTIMLSMNVFYFSKDIENILHLPFKAEEIVMAKFNTIIFMVYEMEILFGIVPLFIYGFTIGLGIGFFINLILALILFPIFSVLVVSSIMIILMKTLKIFRNKDLMQIVLVLLLLFVLMILSGILIKSVFTNLEYIETNQETIIKSINEKIMNANNYFLTINPLREALEQNNIFIVLLQYLKVIAYNLIAIIIFMLLANKVYLKQLLKANFYVKNKKNKTINLNKKIKKKSKAKAYIKKEFKILKRNPMFFIQSIYPIIILTITITVMLAILIPNYIVLLNKEENEEILQDLRFDIEAVCLIIGLIQIVGLNNFSSVTAISREGKNAYIVKYLPISLYKQFIYKNMPQIIINTICSIPILAVIKIQIPSIEIQYIISIFILSILFTMINSFILVLSDLLNPKLEWDAEYDILKNNKNKIFQYALIVFNILFLMFMNKMFKGHNLDISILIFFVVLIIIFAILNIFIYKYKNKIFEKIGE